jgi:hypothetical protein
VPATVNLHVACGSREAFTGLRMVTLGMFEVSAGGVPGVFMGTSEIAAVCGSARLSSSTAADKRAAEPAITTLGSVLTRSKKQSRPPLSEPVL